MKPRLCYLFIGLLCVSSVCQNCYSAPRRHRQPQNRSPKPVAKGMGDLWIAIEGDDVKSLPALLSKIDLADPQYGGLLHMAPTRRIAETLLNRGAPIDGRNDRGETALHRARELGVVEVLLQRQASLTVRDQAGRMPLHSALVDNADDVVARLVEAHTQMQSSEGGSSSDEVVNASDLSGRTPAFFAQTATAMQALIDAGADLGHLDSSGRTIFQVVADRPDDQEGTRNGLLRFLLQHDAPIAAPDQAQQYEAQIAAVVGSQLTAACCVGNESKVRELLQHGETYAAPTDAEETALTPLHAATAYGHPDVVNALIAYGEPVNADDVKFAEDKGCAEIVKQLRRAFDAQQVRPSRPAIAIAGDPSSGYGAPESSRSGYYRAAGTWYDEF